MHVICRRGRLWSHINLYWWTFAWAKTRTAWHFHVERYSITKMTYINFNIKQVESGQPYKSTLVDLAWAKTRTLWHFRVQRYSITKMTHILVKSKLSQALIYLEWLHGIAVHTLLRATPNVQVQGGPNWAGGRIMLTIQGPMDWAVHQLYAWFSCPVYIRCPFHIPFQQLEAP